MKNQLYSEQQKTYLLVVAAFIVAAAVLLALVLWPGQNFNQLIKILLLSVAVIDLVLFWSFSQLTIKITDEFLQINFGVFKKKLFFSEITGAEIADFDKKNYFGYGIRLGKDKSVGYIARDGRGVRLKLKIKDCFFTTENPEEIKRILDGKIGLLSNKL